MLAYFWKLAKSFFDNTLKFKRFKQNKQTFPKQCQSTQHVPMNENLSLAIHICIQSSLFSLKAHSMITLQRLQ